LPQPRPKSIPKRLEIHGHSRIDDYYWLAERENPDVMAHLEAENQYTEQQTAHIRELERTLFEEMKGRIKQDDSSVPYRLKDYFYQTRYQEGQEYPIYARRRRSLDAPEETMLDVNLLAEGHGFFAVGGLAVSSGQDVVAFTQDTIGRRIYDVRFKHLTSDTFLPDTIPNVTSNIAWAEDNKTLFYARQDPQTLRWHQILRHELGTDPSHDVLVYEEADEEFSCFVFKTKSRRFLVIGSEQTVSSEYRFLDASDPTGQFTVFLPRERDHEYSIDHLEDSFVVRTNHEARNFRIVQTPIGHTSRDNWQELIPARDDVLVSGFELFADYLVVAEREDGLTRLRVVPWDGSEGHHIDSGEPTYWAGIGVNPELETRTLRYNYTSLTTPHSVIDYDMELRESQLKKQDEVLGGFQQENYEAERLWAVAADGIRVPISLVRHKSFAPEGPRPLLLYGYGSYGINMDATFNSARLSLLDRGFVFAIAHIRGGQEMGRWWYEDGKLLNKKNTFTDFIACAEHLIAHGHTNPDLLFAEGRSAGGLLMGAVTNMRPDLFKGIVAGVPFVDVVTTMLDDSIPLTTSEYDEWGNPNEKQFYEYMLSYSPYDNVTTQGYPNLLTITGLHDSQVQYWEPAKWVARLRDRKTDDNMVLLKTNTEAGHGGASGRFRKLKETALQYAFMLDLAGLGG
jgi:oligopeptidase B